MRNINVVIPLPFPLHAFGHQRGVCWWDNIRAMRTSSLERKWLRRRGPKYARLRAARSRRGCQGMGPVTVPQASVRYAPPLIETLTFRSQRPVFAGLIRFSV